MFDTTAAVRARIKAMRDPTGRLRVQILDRPMPRRPADLALIMAGIRCYDVTATPVGALARFHIGMNEWLTLRLSDSVAEAFKAIADHIALIGHLPATYSAATDAAERAAAATVLRGVARPLPLAA